MFTTSAQGINELKKICILGFYYTLEFEFETSKPLDIDRQQSNTDDKKQPDAALDKCMNCFWLILQS